MKIKSLTCLLFAVLFTLSFAPIVCAHSVLEHHNKVTIAPMLKKAMPSVVNILVETHPPSYLLDHLPPNLPKNALPKGVMIGSGVIFNAKKGLVVTNAHVIKNQKLIIVTLKNGRRFHAKLIAQDKGFDLAILHIQAKHLTAMPFANSDALQVGDFVAAIGSPFNLVQTVTSGVVSALNRNRPHIEGFQSFIQTDAPINPGNSGGALVNMQGQLVGINTAILSTVDSNIGIGFAIPSNMTQSVIEQLLKYGKVERGMLGVMAQNITPSLKEVLHLKTNQGALVTQVVPHSAAQKAGFKPQDIILKVNGYSTHSANQLRNDLGLMRPGTKIHLIILRDHHKQNLTAVVGDPKKLLAQNQTPFIHGLTLENFNQIEADGSHIRGALVVNVADSSNGALAGIEPGDVITDINNHPISSAQTLKEFAEKINKNTLLVTLIRDHVRLFVVLNQ